MNRIKLMMNTMVVLGILLLGCSMAQAQASRTWVSGVGDDFNPCSRTAPCKTFAGAYPKTADGGVINVIDAGGYGSVTIGKSITIDASESYGGILAPDSNGIVVNAKDTDVVTLRGLTIDGLGTGYEGIKHISGGKLTVEDCRIIGFPNRGIYSIADNKSQLIVKDTIIRDSGGAGILVQPPAGASARVTVEHCRLEGNQNGLSVSDSVQATVRDSVAANNTNNGFLALGSNAAVSLTIESSVSTGNGASGVKAQGTAANPGTVHMSNVTVTNNATGLESAGAGGSIVSYSNNTVAGNVTDGVPDKTLTQL